ncbi:hypothetical protein L21SP3_02270 [Sedimentisphaera cyanobacteriorum]|uniref:Uncharacterized protein n=1 Tax=Sedimentisphaera cyanobacteriorum TaxID=1940790 RepID=A0A1Q2HSL8_9BACT|nr:hypothetical protein [Sedimentisphaera cyanobacteriorum]AQQ10438.1 hypothetical protein L21SP3_02270 [Sedimentisphaera cyanobacteriorum]
MKKKLTELLEEANKGERVLMLLISLFFLFLIFIPQLFSILNNADKHSKYENMIRDAAAEILPEFKNAKVVNLHFETFIFFKSPKNYLYFDNGKNSGVLCVCGSEKSIKLEAQIKDGLNMKCVPLKELSKNPDKASLNFGNRIFAILVWSFLSWLILYRPFSPINDLQKFLVKIHKYYVPPKQTFLFPGLTLLSFFVCCVLLVLGRFFALLLLILLSM